MQSTQEQLIGTVRQATLIDAPQVAELFRPVYTNSSHPFQRLSDIESFLNDPRNFEVVIERDRKIVAGAAMTYCGWNDSYELGRAITHPDYQGCGLAAVLIEEALRQVCARGLGSVFFGFPRVRRIVDIGATMEPRFIPVGHDAGRNVANGKREVHLIMYSIPRHAAFTHVAPCASALGNRDFRESVYGTLGLTAVAGTYPSTIFVGNKEGDCSQYGGFLYNGGSSSANRAIEIVGHDGSSYDPALLSRALECFIADFESVQHVTVTVLADKVEVIKRLLDLGFLVTAYLPAWYGRRYHRFDCVQLASSTYSESPIVQGFDGTLTMLSAELARIYNRVC